MPCHVTATPQCASCHVTAKLQSAPCKVSDSSLANEPALQASFIPVTSFNGLFELELVPALVPTLNSPDQARGTFDPPTLLRPSEPWTPPWPVSPSTSARLYVPLAPLRSFSLSALPGSLIPPAPPWSVGHLALPWLSNPLATPCLSDPSAPPGTFIPTAPPWSSAPPAPPQSSDPPAPPCSSEPPAPPWSSLPPSPPCLQFVLCVWSILRRRRKKPH
ncbi:uncharacterized protein LOC127429687 [Myxocyprinus asiaticus]|uniref:uncharacterized protein LOC127429687 n=1 Tax=Myxocyprinus asiaticus TaxID=70543 RepID=UPI00222219AB|nr:uncharacterized protein LOC127429687 [Myxocyprinus asiaticus]